MMKSKRIIPIFFILILILSSITPRARALVVYFSDGFETFPVGWTTNTNGLGTITKDNTHVYAGSWACKVYDPNDASRAFAYRSMTEATGDYHIQLFVFPTTTVVYDPSIVLIQTYDINPASVSVLLTLRDDGGDIALSSYQLATGFNDISILAADQYYKIDCYIDVSATTMNVWVDNVFKDTVDIYAGDVANPDRVYIGSTGSAQDGEFWIDEVLINDDMSLPILPPSDPNLCFGAGFNASTPYVELHWNHSLEDVQFFEVQNSSDSLSWTYLGQSTTANYTDIQVVNGTMRYYRVRACNQTGGAWYNSSFSDVNFDKVYFITGAGAAGPGAIVTEESFFWIPIAIVLSIIAGLLVWLQYEHK